MSNFVTVKGYKVALLSLLVAVLVFVESVPVFGSVTVKKTNNLTITRIAGSNRYETSIDIANELKKELKVSKFKNIILADGRNYPDALSGSYLASVKSAPILLINEGSASTIVNYVRNNLVSGGTVYILGGEGAVSKEVEELLDGLHIKRLAGSNRYETNLKVLKESNALKSDEIMVCSGKDFPDALAAAAVGRPILLVNEDLYKEQKEYLSASKDKKLWLIGGEGVVSRGIATEMKLYGKTERVAGDNRYGTSLAIANKFFLQNQEKVILAYSRGFADALSAGPLAILRKAPIVLSANDNLAYPYNYIIHYKSVDITILGGKSLIADESVGGTQKINSEITVDRHRYYIKSNGRMAQSEIVYEAGIQYVAQQSGIVTSYGHKGTKGIDVSAYQREIDWKKVKNDGVKFAFIKVGGRFGASGLIYTDGFGKTNLKNATKNGIKVGVYFYTQAISKKEAIEEAQFCLNAVKGYDVKLPIVIDTEYLGGGRHDNIGATLRTQVVQAFCETIEANGYKPMVYANLSWLNNNLYMSKLQKYDVWVAHYNSYCGYTGKYVCWQYTSTGRVNGIQGNVDMNIWYGGGI